MSFHTRAQHVALHESSKPIVKLREDERSGLLHLSFDDFNGSGYIISAPPDVLLSIVGDIQDAVLGIAEREPAL